MNLDIEALRAAAEKATPGPWYHHGTEYTDAGGQYEEVTSSVEYVLGESGSMSPENAAFIALTNPAAVLALIAQRDALLEAAKQAQSVLLMLTEPKEIRATSVHHAWAQAVAAEVKARAAITLATGGGE